MDSNTIEWVRVYRTRRGAGVLANDVLNILRSSRKRRMKSLCKRIPTKNGGWKIGGGSWKVEIPISWGLEIVIHRITYNLEKTDKLIPDVFQ